MPRNFNLIGCEYVGHNLAQEVTDRRRPKRGEHVPAVALARTVGISDVSKVGGIDSYELRETISVFDGILCQGISSLDGKTDFVARVVARILRACIGSVVGRRTLWNERQAIRVVVRIEQA